MTSNLDPNLNLPLQTNFNYYTTSDFRNSYDIANCSSGKHFSVMHSNTRSLNANYDGLMQINHSFSLIGLTETKYKVVDDIQCSHSMPGYSFLSQPSLSNAGGLVSLFLIN